ncbi:50S ribosomal protein L10 [Mycoplasmopsis pulmonis]|uniref:Large ribosomal subunit protein uL10 n=1 Tax=Mycoplasmopsis pulmonis (strain UAB CTIP) TaxID=272635 RepID=RL10_MYCPU|nr:50S ribosomal protein L10 [Mycoplasmopsis pulmonis]Q98QS1.2 RecName: Full=Large ribosomal subunit protein uL10; AltName: Full=50S ribosomal protein L10 [Mycoplasmopsis pulmonis UAB CTIP]MDZ7293249.1 50S ribosomal protein L10 [Mycoplasmopsis pulmonis]VEU68051.1 50S ribosomal protein L10 [Mycoplasmopsis pulmonis]
MHIESKNRQIKKDIVVEITKKINDSQSLFLAEYRGLTVAKLLNLRKEAKKHNVEIKVYKNRLVKLATQKLGHSDLDKFLVGPNLFVFSNELGMDGAKVLAEFAKKNKKLVLKAGIFDGKVVDAAGVKAVAELPTYEEALTILASSLLGPLRQISLSFKLLVDENKLSN